MRTRMISLVAAGLLLAGPAMAQNATPAEPPQPAKPADPNSLDAALAAALKSNPDIQVAEAKVREAEATLNKARVTVMQQVVAAHAAVQTAKASLVAAETLHRRYRDLRTQGTIDAATTDKAELELQKAKSELARAEADLSLVLGKSPSVRWRVSTVWDLDRAVREVAFSPDGTKVAEAGKDGTVRVWDTVTGRLLSGPGEIKPGSMAERIKAALDKPVTIDAWKEPLPVADVIDYLKRKAGADIPVRLVAKVQPTAGVDLMTGTLPLSAWLLAVEDSLPELRIVVREYGLLVTTRDRLPEDAVRLRDFLRAPAAKKQ